MFACYVLERIVGKACACCLVQRTETCSTHERSSQELGRSFRTKKILEEVNKEARCTTKVRHSYSLERKHN